METTRLQDEMQITEQRLFKERESVRNLESVVCILRQERVQQENQLRSLSIDLNRLQQRESLLREELWVYLKSRIDGGKIQKKKEPRYL